MHIDKSSGINKNNDNVELQQQIHQSQQASVFGEGFHDKNADGLVNAFDFDHDEIIVKKLKNEGLLNKLWKDVGDKISIVLKGYQKQDRLPQVIEIIRQDGIKIELKDGIFFDIPNDDNANFSDYQGIPVQCVITDPKGIQHKIEIVLGDCQGRDLLDCRRVKMSLGNYLSKISSKVINEIINKNVDEITIYGKKQDWHKKTGINFNNNVEIVSKDFEIPARNYNKVDSFTRDDGCKFEIKDISNTSSILNITIPDKKTFSIKIDGAMDINKYHQFQLQKLKSMLNELPIDVLDDLSNEIEHIILADWSLKYDATYAEGTDAFVLRAENCSLKDNVDCISFVHEIGHAIDDTKGCMQSKRKEFTDKFNKLVKLAKKLNINEHSLDNAQEFMASMYATLSLPSDQSKKNHINNLDNKILQYKNFTDDSDEKDCYKVYLELKQDAKIIINGIKQLPKEERMNNPIKQIVEQEFAETIKKLDAYMLSGKGGELKETNPYHSTKLNIITTLLESDDIFYDCIENLKARSEDETFIYDDEIRQVYTEMINKLIKVRKEIKS